jgi:hypothetical protein
LRGLKIGYELFDSEFFVKATHPTWGVVTFSLLVHFGCFFNGPDAPEESSIYFLDTKHNGALLQKQQAKPYLRGSDTGLPTLLIVAFKRA